MCSITQDILQVAGEAKLKYGILSNAKILFYDACFLGHPHRFVQVRRVRCCIHTDTKRLKKCRKKATSTPSHQLGPMAIEHHSKASK